MDNAMMIEIFGYIGSALVVVSMLMSSIVKLRIINTVGSVISGIYAVICGAIPLAVMNQRIRPKPTTTANPAEIPVPKIRAGYCRRWLPQHRSSSEAD